MWYFTICFYMWHVFFVHLLIEFCFIWVKYIFSRMCVNFLVTFFATGFKITSYWSSWELWWTFKFLKIYLWLILINISSIQNFCLNIYLLFHTLFIIFVRITSLLIFIGAFYVIGTQVIILNLFFFCLKNFT
jgi:hypothetical protein